MKYWLLKTEPSSFSIQDLAAAPAQTTHWDGVRNYQARNFLRDEMSVGDRVLLYHSNADPSAVVGVAVVVRAAYPDASAFNSKDPHFDPKSDPDRPTWFMVDIQLERIFEAPLPLDTLRPLAALKAMELLRKGSRLSVQPVRKTEFVAIQVNSLQAAEHSNERIAMLQNPLIELWKRDGAAYTGWLTIPSAWSAEVMAHAGYDALVIDMQHGLMDFAGMLSMLQALGTTEVVPLVRAPWNEASALMRALDAGAYGVICPMIDTRTDCEAFVAACRYPPAGIRSFGPTRSLVSIGTEYVAQAAAFALTFALIETAAGLANVEAIASVPGLTGLYVGPWDLSLGMGLPTPGNLLDPDLSRACDTILEAARRHGLIAGIYTNSAEDGRRMAARGFRLVNIATDTVLLQRGATAELRKARNQSEI